MNEEDRFVKKLGWAKGAKDKWNRRLLRCSWCLAILAGLSIFGALCNIFVWAPMMPQMLKHHGPPPPPDHRGPPPPHDGPPPPFDDWEDHPGKGKHQKDRHLERDDFHHDKDHRKDGKGHKGKHGQKGMYHHIKNLVYGASIVDLFMWGLVFAAAFLGIRSTKQETSDKSRWYTRRARVCVYIALLFGIGRLVCSFKLVKELSRIMPKKGEDDWRHQGFKDEFDPAR